MNIISNTFEDNGIGYQRNDNPVDQILKLHDEKINLCERMLKEKNEMMARLERLI